MRNGIGAIVLAFMVMAVVGAVAQDRPPVIPRYGMVELTLTCSDRFDNPFRDAVCAAEFVSPSGKKTRVEGFYDGGDQWRIRFVPREHGNWTWNGRITGGTKPVEASGSFHCEGTQGHGFLRISRKNPFRYEYEDGTPFYPIGIQTCNFLNPDFDGPEAGKGENRWVSNTEWVQAFTGAVNLVRTQFGQGTTAGCALPLIAAPPRKQPGKESVTNFVYQADRYDLALAAKIDAVYREQRAAGISQILILFQDMSAWKDSGKGMNTAFGAIRDLAGYKSTEAPSLPLQEQYIRYVIARYGAFVDIWEIFNEDSYAPADYLAHLAGVIRKADPYGRPLTSNFSIPGAEWSDITTWHEYMGMPANAVDTYVVSQVAVHKSHGKLVQNTEFGNQGILSNVDPVKWRIAVWAAHMHEAGLLFWSMSQSKIPAGHVKSGNANAYIGPDSRQHFRVFHAITRDLPVDLKPVTIGFTEQTDIRAYALCNGKQGLIYIHHFADHGKPFAYAEKLMVQSGPGNWRLRWYHPEDGRELTSQEINTPQQFLFFRMPEATVDLVATLERIGDPLSKEQQLQALYAAGKEAAKARDWAAAEAKWKEALALDPQSWEVLNHYAWFLVDTVPAEMRDPDKALGMAVKANDLTEGKNRDILDTLAEIWFQKKDFTKAVEFSRKSLEPGLQGHSKPKALQRQLEKFEKALLDSKAGQGQP